MSLLKRAGLLLLAAAVLLPLSACAYGLVIAPLRNDRAAARLLDGLLAELPPETEIVETAVWAGNSSGTGNHVEIWAGILNRSGVGFSAEELRDSLWGWDLRFGFPVTADPGKLFPSLPEDWDGYYIYGRLGEAATQWDLRGH